MTIAAVRLTHISWQSRTAEVENHVGIRLLCTSAYQTYMQNMAPSRLPENSASRAAAMPQHHADQCRGPMQSDIEGKQLQTLLESDA